MRVLVTGASGLVGRHLVLALSKAGMDVTGVARRPVHGPPGQWLSADLTMPGAAQEIIRTSKPELLIHLAWVTEHGQFWRSPDNLRWLSMTCDLAIAAAEGGVRRVVMTGTCFEYAFPATGDCIEGQTPTEPHFIYDIAKDASRRACEAYFALTGVSFSWARLFHLYGPREHADRLVASVCRALLRGELAKCSSGLAVRDFMHVADAGAALAALALSKVSGTVNVASGQAVTIADIATTLGALAGRPDLIRLGALPDRKDEPPRIVADARRLRAEVGFYSRIALREGLADTLSWWRDQT